MSRFRFFEFSCWLCVFVYIFTNYCGRVCASCFLCVIKCAILLQTYFAMYRCVNFLLQIKKRISTDKLFGIDTSIHRRCERDLKKIRSYFCSSTSPFHFNPILEKWAQHIFRKQFFSSSVTKKTRLHHAHDKYWAASDTAHIFLLFRAHVFHFTSEMGKIIINGICYVRIILCKTTFIRALARAHR